MSKLDLTNTSFNGKVKVIEYEEIDGCWYLPNTKHRVNEYMKYEKEKPGQNRYTRGIYEALHNVRLETEQLCCHTCDNPNCINPNHIFIGSNEDNVNDMKAKGRAWNTSENGHKIKKDMYEAIIRDYEEAMANKTGEHIAFPVKAEIARRFNVFSFDAVKCAYHRAMGFVSLDVSMQLGFGNDEDNELSSMQQLNEIYYRLLLA